MEIPTQDSRRWYDKKRFVIPLLFIFPVGLILMWVGESFQKNVKIGITIFFSIMFIWVIMSPKPTTKTTTSVNNEAKNITASEGGVVQYNNNGEVVGKVQEEKGVEVSMKIISQDFMGKEKAAFDIRLSDRATTAQLESMANVIKEKHPGYKRYFIGYYLPNDVVNTGYWATTHFDPNLEVRILGLTYAENEKLENTKIDFKGKKIGRWQIEMGTLSNIAVISKLDNGKYLFTSVYKDGSSGEKELTKKGDKYIYENDFGEYYKIEKDGRLAHYSENGKFAVYETVD